MPPTPNILLIHGHDLGRQLGCYGREGVSTPTLDRFAREGVRFAHAFATAATCSPSRGSLMTGLYPHAHGLEGLTHEPFNWRYRAGIKTLPMYLREAGYRTYLFGLQHEGNDPAELGYDAHFETDAGCRCGPVAARFVEFLASEQAQQKLFFASVGFWEAHRWGKRGFPTEEYSAIAASPSTLSAPPGVPNHELVLGELDGLGRCIGALDLACERILDALEKAGLSENTWVIFTTDHGLAFPRAKATLYDAGLETALLMRWPRGFSGDRVNSGLISNVDVVPTILEGIDRAELANVQGVSFWSWLKTQDGTARSEIFAEKAHHTDYDPVRMIRTPRYKYINNLSVYQGYAIPNEISYASAFQGTLLRPTEELYDLVTDSDECVNLADNETFGGVKRALAQRLDDWRPETQDTLPAVR